MANARFFANRGPFRLSRLAEISGASLGLGADPTREIRDVAPLETAGPDDITFLDNARYVEAFAATAAGACVVAEKFAGHAPPGVTVLLSQSPYQAYALIAQAFYPRPAPTPGVHPTAMVGPQARLGDDCEIGAHVVIGAGARLGARAIIGASAVLGDNVVLGDDCIVGASVSLECCLIGDRATIQPGARIGPAGFGFAPNPATHIRVPQVGRVRIGDDCRIGANATIARGSAHDTVIGNNVWIDNLVQIAHNVEIGDGSILVAQAGIAGSTKLGKFVIMAAQAGLIGHLEVGDGAQIGAQAGVIRDIAAAETVLGSPAMAIREFWRQVAAVRRLSKQRKEGND